jgi:hypothetical protein
VPKWSTPERRQKLAELLIRSGGFCVYGERPCPYPHIHHFEKYVTGLAKDWISDDREAKSYLNKILKSQLHRIPERGSLRGTFNFVSRDIYFDSQPQYYIEALGVNGFTFRPFAKIRLASSFMYLYVDIGEPLKGISKNKRRKAVRYGQSLPVEIQRQVQDICNRTIARYLSK